MADLLARLDALIRERRVEARFTCLMPEGWWMVSVAAPSGYTVYPVTAHTLADAVAQYLKAVEVTNV